MTNAVYYISATEFDLLAEGSAFDLVGDEGHHAKNVKRAEAGEGIDLADGAGRRATGSVLSLLDAGIRVSVDRITEQSEQVAIYLVQALAKGDRDIQAIEMATELGACGIVPWSADRSIVRWKMERAAKAHAKWQNTVRAAAKQSRRAVIPKVFEQHSSTDLAELARELGDKALFLVLHEQAEHRLTQELSASLSETVEEIYFLVGPEGGVSPRELGLLQSAGARVVLLGDEVLRSSTAGAAAISTLNVALGRW